MGNNNKDSKLQFTSSAPWQKGKTDSPNLGIQLNPNDLRWEVHQAEKRKTAEQKQKEYTQKQIKNNSKTTWRTYAADAMHGIGEGAMMLNPYTTGAYFGAKALNSAMQGNTTEAVTNAGFAAMPWAGQWLPKLVGSVEAVGRGINKGMQVLNSPLTGKWTQFGNTEVRLAPGYVGMNGGSPLQTRPVYRSVDHMLENTLERDNGLLYSGSNNAASITGTTPERVIETIQRHPNTATATQLMNGRYALEETVPNAFREILLENEEQLASKGLIPGRVQTRRIASQQTPIITSYEDETLRRIPNGSVIGATESRISTIPREELAKKGVGLDMSEGGTPYLESDIFLPNGEVKPEIDLRLFHSSKPGRNNVAYWYPKSREFSQLAPEEQARRRVGTYMGATTNSQALREELERIGLSNPTNVSGTYGSLADFDLNPNSFKSMLGNLRRQLRMGRTIRLIERPNDEYEYLLPNQLHQEGRYIEQIDPELRQIFRTHYNANEDMVSKKLMNRMFGSDEAFLGIGNIPQSTGKLSAQEFRHRLSNFLNQKANLREKFLTPNNLIFERTNEGYRIRGDASLGNRDFGILRPNSIENQYDDLMNSFNKFKDNTKMNLPSPKLITEQNAEGLIDTSNLSGKFKLIGIPNITTFTFNKGGKINAKKLIKRCK